MMENYLKTGLLLLVLGFTGCSSDDSDPLPGLSTEQLDALSGNWILVEYNVNPPQDLDKDDTYSENLIDELDCISGTLTISQDMSWDQSYVRLDAISITGGDFAIFCRSTATASGQWRFENNVLSLFSDGDTVSLSFNGNSLTQTPDADLPGVKRLVYQKLEIIN